MSHREELILPSRWQDGDESLGIERPHKLSMLIRLVTVPVCCYYVDNAMPRHGSCCKFGPNVRSAVSAPPCSSFKKKERKRLFWTTTTKKKKFSFLPRFGRSVGWMDQLLPALIQNFIFQNWTRHFARSDYLTVAHIIPKQNVIRKICC